MKTSKLQFNRNYLELTIMFFFFFGAYQMWTYVAYF